MAIDTAAKRASALRFARPWAGILFPPDGSVSQDARQSVAFMYGGILAGAAVSGASTARIYLGARWLNQYIKHGESQAIVYGGAEFAGVALPNSDDIGGGGPGNLKSWLPPQRVAIAYVEVMENGQMVRKPAYVDAATWYKFFTFVAEIKLGGVNGPTLTNVADDVVLAKAQVSNVVSEQAVVTQQVNANAEALKVTVEVAQGAALAGASQIPEVIIRALIP